MTVSFTGLVAHRNPANLTFRAETGHFDVGYLKRFAQAHEAAGFDRVLIGYGSTQPDGLHLGTYVAAVTEKLGIMLAHRPGSSPPPLLPAPWPPSIICRAAGPPCTLFRAPTMSNSSATAIF